MPKRFTDTNKWADPWFRRLQPRLKLFWQYICDNCDNAGVWKVDYEIASFYIGEQVGSEDILALNQDKERLILANSYYLIVKDFISYQIGNINSKELTNLQKNCKYIINQYVSKGIDIVNITNLTGKLPVAIRYKYKGKDKGKDNNKDIVIEKDKYLDYILLYKSEYDKLLSKLGIEATTTMIERLNNYIGSKGVKYKSHYHTILNWVARDPQVLNNKSTKPIDTSAIDLAKRKKIEEEAALVDPAEVRKLLEGVKNKIGNSPTIKK